MPPAKRAPRRARTPAATADEAEKLPAVFEVKNSLRGPSLYSVALSADGDRCAIGQSDGTVRIFDLVRDRTVRVKLRGTVTALAMGSTHAVAIAGGAEHRIQLATRAAQARILLGAELAGAAIRGKRFAVGGDNVGSGPLEEGVDSYCGMPVSDGEVFGPVALSADGTRVAGIRVRGRNAPPSDHPAKARVFIGLTDTGPSAAEEVWQWEPKPRTRSALGFIGDRLVLAEASATSFAEPGADPLEVMIFDRVTRTIFTWPNAFRPATVAICDDCVVAVGQDGRVARMVPDGACKIDRRRAEPWLMSSISADGHRIALAYPFGASVYDIP